MNGVGFRMTCPYCTTDGDLGIGDKNRPFWFCRKCVTWAFFDSGVAVAGFALLSGLVAAAGRDRWVALLSGRKPSITPGMTRCLLCAESGKLDYNKKNGWPYCSCKHCFSRVFFKSDLAVAGFGAASTIVSAVGSEEWKSIVARRMEQTAVAADGRMAIPVVAPPTAAEHPKSSKTGNERSA